MSEDDIRTEGQQDSCGVEEASAATSVGASARPAMRIDDEGYQGDPEYPYITHIDGRRANYYLESLASNGIEGRLTMRAVLEDGREECWTLPEPVVDYSNGTVGRALVAMTRHLRSVLRMETPEDRERYERQAAVRERAERARSEERRVQAVANARRAEKRREKARERAQATLRLFLSEDRRTQYDTYGYIDVLGSSGLNTYRIHPQFEGNVELLDDHRQETGSWYCAGPREPDNYGDGDGLPLADGMLAQMLMLSANEVEYFRHANIYKGRRWPTRLPGLREVLAARGYVYTDENWERGGERPAPGCSCFACR